MERLTKDALGCLPNVRLFYRLCQGGRGWGEDMGLCGNQNCLALLVWGGEAQLASGQGLLEALDLGTPGCKLPEWNSRDLRALILSQASFTHLFVVSPLMAAP